MLIVATDFPSVEAALDVAENGDRLYIPARTIRRLLEAEYFAVVLGRDLAAKVLAHRARVRAGELDSQRHGS